MHANEEEHSDRACWLETHDVSGMRTRMLEVSRT